MAQMESMDERKGGGLQISAILFALKNLNTVLDDILEGPAAPPQPPAAAGPAAGGGQTPPRRAGSEPVQARSPALAALHRGECHLRAAAAQGERNKRLSEEILLRLRSMD
jgi:hypothetical protein